MVSLIYELTPALVEKAKSNKYTRAGVKAIKSVLSDKASLPPGKIRGNLFGEVLKDTKDLAKYWKQISPEK